MDSIPTTDDPTLVAVFNQYCSTYQNSHSYLDPLNSRRLTLDGVVAFFSLLHLDAEKVFRLDSSLMGRILLFCMWLSRCTANACTS